MKLCTGAANSSLWHDNASLGILLPL